MSTRARVGVHCAFEKEPDTHVHDDMTQVHRSFLPHHPDAGEREVAAPASLGVDNKIQSVTVDGIQADIVDEAGPGAGFEGRQKFVQRCQKFVARCRDSLDGSIYALSKPSDKEVVLAAMGKNAGLLKDAPRFFREDKDVVLAAVMNDGRALEFVWERAFIWGDYKEVVSVAVRKNGEALQYACKTLQNDREAVLAAVAQNGGSLQYASATLWEDDEVVKTALGALGHCQEAERMKVALAAVRKNGLLLQFVSGETLQEENYREVVLAAVRNNGWALLYAPYSFLRDRVVVLAAVGTAGPVLQFVSKLLQNDREVVWAAVGNKGLVLQGVDESFRKDKDVVLAAVRNDGLALQFVPEDTFPIESYYEMVWEAVRNNGRALQHASNSLQNDMGVVVAAVRSNGRALQFASETLRSNWGVVLAAVEQNGWSFRYVSEALRWDHDHVVVETAMKHCHGEDGSPMTFDSIEQFLLALKE